jgi:TetR/AcrR family transcriptional repressor of mexJK operon
VAVIVSVKRHDRHKNNGIKIAARNHSMKTWKADHPKAALMARKRADILAAARCSFLEKGYEGTSMEAIAKAADVSIMTLYRHAKTKDDLFSAVVSCACDSTDEAKQAELAELMRKPLPDILAAVGIVVQQSLLNADTVALLRSVIAETVRFPTLAQTAYGGLVGHMAEVVVSILEQKDSDKRLTAKSRRQLAGQFVDRLIGSDMLRVLLGIPGLTAEAQKRRARQAADELMLKIAAASN